MLENSEPVSAFAIYSQLYKDNSETNTNKRKNKRNNNKAKKQKISHEPDSGKNYKNSNKSKENGHTKNNVASKTNDNIKVKTTNKLKQKNENKITNATPPIQNGNKVEKTNKSPTNSSISKKTKQNQIGLSLIDVFGSPIQNTNHNKFETSVPISKGQHKLNGESFSPKNVSQTPRLTNQKKEDTKKSQKVVKKVQAARPNLQKCSSGYFYVDNFDSVKTGEQMFSWIMNPVDIKQFFKETWETQPLILRRQCPSYYSNILTCEDIDRALRRQTLYFTKNVDITSYSASTGVRETHNPPGRATAPQVWDFYANGCSVRILNPQTFFPKVMRDRMQTDYVMETWETQPLILRRQCPSYYSNILTCEDFDRALRRQTLYFTKNVDITSYSASTGVRETHNPPGRATAPQVWDFYANGCSVRILNPQTFFPKVHALNAALQEYFGCFVGANVYLTPADSQGFAPHYDDIEAFVMQLEGEKLWRLYAPRNPGEVLPRFSSGNFTDSDLGEPIQEVLLKQGDVMYFPRGFIHQGVALGTTHSLHITLSVYQKNSWADLLEILLPAALKSAIEEDVSFRAGLPMNSLSNLGLVHSDKTNDIRTGFLQTLQNLMTKLVDYAPVDAAVDQVGKKFIHDSLPPFLREEEKETTVYGDGERIKNGEIQNQAEMCLATRIKLIRYNCIRMIREEDTIRIYHSVGNSKEYHEEEAQFLDIDEDLAPAVDALIHSYPQYMAVEDLPVEDDIEKVQIASDLWECGILKTEEPLSYESE